ncbi:hypothetical protein SapgrDRAFT_3452 [Saprospira grandis DSM 2844]|uniref:Lipoprotein n=1 Tax=Saprospira grandis DSM 2844 TaxID=694433 RepID=J0P5B7_9BACT|nr:hypothetical protein [Saprospira grandis]EJF55089.1 hypothetical protein SapgrDRAFT_3452 [Saprospira grandis DSM 2844]
MRNFSLFFFLFLLFSLTACKKPKPVTVEQKRPNFYLPAELGNIVLNMSWKELQTKRPKMAPINYVQDALSFRKEFYEEIGRDSIKRVFYYIDSDSPQPLYEILVEYQDKNYMKEEAERLLGQPNSNNGSEWLFDSRQGFKIRAWLHETRLVFAGEIPGTEWSELD